MLGVVAMNENREILDKADQNHHGGTRQTDKEGYFEHTHQEHKNQHDAKIVPVLGISIS